MRKQFAHFDGRFTEATVTDLYGARYTYCAVCLLRLGEMLGDGRREFVTWGVEDLAACATHTYDPQSHSFWAMLIDGTKLSPADRKQGGYFHCPHDGRGRTYDVRVIYPRRRGEPSPR